MTADSTSEQHNSSANGIALRMTGISKRFGPVQALRKVSFTVRAGTVHALVGENGAGKSTLMKILAGVHLPDNGTIEIQGKDCKFANPGQAIAGGVSMIYQELDLAEHLTVAENIFLGAEPKAKLPLFLNNKEMIRHGRQLTQQHNFDIKMTARVEELPTGDCQIVEILKALRRNASILVMDEPTSSLSETEAQRLFEVVRQLRRQGLTIIYISHRLEEIIDLADEVSVLRDGALVHSERIEQLDIPKIVHHMVGRELNDFFPQRLVTLGETSVKVENLSSQIGIDSVSFEIRRGEIVGVAGLVGAGRTETAQTIFGVAPKSSGRISIDGQEVQINSPADAIKQGVAFLTEDRKRTGLCLQLPCSWNITLPNLDNIGMKHKISPSRENRIAAEVAQKISIKWHGPQAPADTLSGGNQQKLLIARWLLAESKFLIFDEPTRGIDVGAKAEIYSLLNHLAQQGKAILFISSELPELFGVADRILVMRRGRLVGNLDTKKTSQELVMHLAAVEENYTNDD